MPPRKIEIPKLNLPVSLQKVELKKKNGKYFIVPEGDDVDFSGTEERRVAADTTSHMRDEKAIGLGRGLNSSHSSRSSHENESENCCSKCRCCFWFFGKEDPKSPTGMPTDLYAPLMK